SGDKEGKKRKRLSFSAVSGRARSDTADTTDHSQIAREVVAVYGSEDKPTVDTTTPPLDSSIEYTKIDNVVDAPAAEDSTKDSTSTEPTAVEEAPVATKEDKDVSYDAHVEEEKYTPDVIQITPEIEVHPPVTYHLEEPAPRMPEPVPYQHPSQDVDVDQTKLNTRDYEVVMDTSPSQSMVNITVEKAAPSFPEPVTYDTSFNSTSSAPEPSSAPATHTRYSGQPLSAIDELRAKTHPLEEWKQQPQPQPPKEDVNYDADEYVRVMTLFFLLPAVLFLGIPYLFPHHVLELASMEEAKPLLDSSILTENPIHSTHHPLNDSILSLRTDLKGKNRDPPQIYETLGWTQYVLPDSSIYFVLHVSSPASPQHLKMPTPITASPTVTVVADFDLRDPAILKKVCEEMRTLIKMELPSAHNSFAYAPDHDGWELWLHRPIDYDPSKLDEKRPAIIHTWVNHSQRTLSPRPLDTVDLPPSEDGDAVTLVDGHFEERNYEKLAKELVYWAFVEKHPAHGRLPLKAKKDAVESLTWSYADRLLQSEQGIGPCFTQDECQSLLRILESYSFSLFEAPIGLTHITVKHRLASLEVDRAAKSQSRDGGKDTKGRASTVPFPFRRAVFGFFSAVVCWGIPYLFLDNVPTGTDPLSRFRPLESQRRDGNQLELYYSSEDAGAHAERKTSAMLYGAGAAIVIGSATTVLTLRPPLGTPARTAGFVALLCAGASLAASLISLARLSRVSHRSIPYSTYSPSSDLFFPGIQRDTESLIVLNAQPIRRAVPLVLLAYSIR
ncbi:9182_t:CDS:10, partial [Acaulospora colombiana]